ALAENQLIAAVGSSGANGVAVRAAIPHFRRWAADEIHERRRPVEVVVQSIIDLALRAAGPLDDHRDVTGGVVGGGMLAIDAELPLILTVVGTDDDCSVFVHAGRLQLFNDARDHVVDVADGGVIAIDPLLAGLVINNACGASGPAFDVHVVVHGRLL